MKDNRSEVYRNNFKQNVKDDRNRIGYTERGDVAVHFEKRFTFPPLNYSEYEKKTSLPERI